MPREGEGLQIFVCVCVRVRALFSWGVSCRGVRIWLGLELMALKASFVAKGFGASSRNLEQAGFGLTGTWERNGPLGHFSYVMLPLLPGPYDAKAVLWHLFPPFSGSRPESPSLRGQGVCGTCTQVSFPKSM